LPAERDARIFFSFSHLLGEELMTKLVTPPNADFFASLSDDELRGMKFSMPWQVGYDGGYEDSKDADGFDTTKSADGGELSREELQRTCWEKFHLNPQINTSVRGLMGRLTGMGFETSSENTEINDAINEVYYDHRNRLYNYFPKFVARSNIEGELFLCLTCHDDGFIEVDFVDPSNVTGGGDESSGIIFHPSKPLFPLYYNITNPNDLNPNKQIEQIPSINMARYPDLINVANKIAAAKGISRDYQKNSIKTKRNPWQKLGYYYRFIVAWDKGFMTRRAVSFLRTTLQWLNHYENLKKYEIDHKKSSGSYLWTFQFEDARSFKLWLALTPEQRATTGIMAKKTPGGTLVIPPGIKLVAVTPQLPKISDGDTDILEMVASGLNEPSDIMTGSSKGTFAAVKASRGPMTDRTSDEIAYFDRFLKYDFWSAVFFLKSQISKFPSVFKVNEAVSFDKKQEPVFKTIPKKPEFLIDISYPISESSDTEAQARAFLGVKHGNMSDTLGIPNSYIAKKIGIGSYGRQRLIKATEDEKYPELVSEADLAAAGMNPNDPGNQETNQEKKIVTPTKKLVKPAKKS
jgi:hypothetical protein